MKPLSPNNNKQLAKTLYILAILLLLAWAVKAGLFEQVADKQWVANIINEDGWSGDGLVFGCAVLFTAFGGPRQLVAFVYGYSLGGLCGALMALLAAITGCAVSFYFARFTCKSLLQKHFGKRIQRFEAFIQQRTWLKVVVIRFLPFGSNLVTNLLAGVTHTPSIGFFSGSLLGYLPQTLIFAYAGAGIGFSDHSMLLVSCGLLLLSSAIGTYLYRSHMRRQVDELIAEDNETQS